MKECLVLFFCLLLVSLVYCGSAAAATPVYGYRVVHVYPHDSSGFTEGLSFDEDGNLFESTGLWGESTLRRIDPASGKVLKKSKLPETYFGEGIAVVSNHIVMVTWQDHIGIVYDKENFGVIRNFKLPGEGWGITYDGQHLVVSDGSARLILLDPNTFKQVGHVDVVGEDGPVGHLNELEYVRGEVWANVWQTEKIARIDPRTGYVVGWIDLAGLRDWGASRTDEDVPNGIAFDQRGGRIFVTGKFWPKLFEIEIVPKDQ